MGRWLRRNWYQLVKNGVFLAVAVTIIVIGREYNPLGGVVLGLFMLQWSAANTLIVLTGQAAEGHVIDLRDAARRMFLVFSGQGVILGILVIMALFSKIKWLALLPGLPLPLRIFLFFKLKQDYQKQPAGEYMQKGKYD
ncbi:MAG TPA: hypothetical protein VFI02_20380 [Armatimonadota bacterium]|nr:hypothetical protein [Armatimonadota bacterium]